MKKIILHIGAGKTGTSAIQSYLSINKDFLEKEGYYYQDTNSEKAAKNFKITSGNAVYLGQTLKKGDFSKRNLIKIITDLIFKKNLAKIISNSIKKAQGKHIIFSSEVLEAFDEERMKILKKIVAKKGYNLIIVYYIRAIADQTVSLYHQLLKRHAYTRSFTEFAQQHNNRFLNVIEKSIRVLGKESVIIKNYDKVKQNIFPDFLQSVLHINNISHFKIKNKKVNRSLTKSELFLMRDMNKFFTKSSHSTFISNALIHASPNASYEMTIEQKDADYLQAIYEDDTEKLNSYLQQNEKPLNIIENLQIVSKEIPAQLNPFQSSVLAILAELTKEIKGR